MQRAEREKDERAIHLEGQEATRRRRSRKTDGLNQASDEKCSGLSAINTFENASVRLNINNVFSIYSSGWESDQSNTNIHGEFP